MSQYQKGKTNLDFIEARDSEWQWHQLGQMQVCTLPQTGNHTSTLPLSFLQAGCRSCSPTNSVKALKDITVHTAINKSTNQNRLEKCYEVTSEMASLRGGNYESCSW